MDKLEHTVHWTIDDMLIIGDPIKFIEGYRRYVDSPAYGLLDSLLIFPFKQTNNVVTAKFNHDMKNGSVSTIDIYIKSNIKNDKRKCNENPSLTNPPKWYCRRDDKIKSIKLSLSDNLFIGGPSWLFKYLPNLLVMNDDKISNKYGAWLHTGSPSTLLPVTINYHDKYQTLHIKIELDTPNTIKALI